MATTTTTKTPKKRDFRPVWLVGPSMALLAVVIGYPVVRAVYLSFQSDRHLDKSTGMFVDGGFAGFDHYLYWLTQRCMSPNGTVSTCAPGNLAMDFWPALRVTLFFVVVTVALETVLGLWMATVMNRSFVGRSLLRAAVLVPWAIPTAVTAKLWQFMFAPDGIVNSLTGLDVAWTTDPWAARFAVIIADVWKTAPFMALLILAGLQMVPAGVYEAARVDGASRGLAFRKVILPLAAPALFTTAILAFIATWNEFMLAKQLSTPTTEPVTVAIARFTGASAFQYPYAATMAAGALVTIPLVIMVLVFQRRIVSGLTAGGVK